MTIVCVRLDESFSAPRLTAIADARASRKLGPDRRKPVSEKTVKLFAVPVRCFRMDNLRSSGAWEDPYFETVIGLGFSGSCFEGLTVIAHVTQSLGVLMDPDGKQPLPSRDGLINIVAKLTQAYFDAHTDKSEDEPNLTMALFGYDKGRPWIATISWKPSEGLRQTDEWATSETLVSIGETPTFRQYAEKWRTAIRRHKAGLRPPAVKRAADFEALFRHELEQGRHGQADKKLVEEALLKQVENEFATSIGGKLQRLELGVDNDGQVSAAFTREDGEHLDTSSYTVSDDGLLVPAFVVERMGRRVRDSKR